MHEYVVRTMAAAGVAALALAGAAEARFAPTAAGLPVMTRAPSVNGVIEEEEWNGAARWVGVCGLGGSTLTHRAATLWLGSDGRRIYLAVKSETPPDRPLVANHKPAEDDSDTEAFRDDSIEVWLDPYKQASPARGLYQGIFNSLGALYDVNHQPPDAWRGDWQVANRVVDGWWHCEASISLESLGAKGPLPGQTWGFRLVRNWRAPGKQAPLSPLALHFSDRGSMCVVRWLAAAPVVQMLDTRTADGKQVSYSLRLRNPCQAPVTVHLRLDSQPTDSQHAYLEETVTLAPGETRPFKLDHFACHAEEPIYTRVHVASPDGAAVYFHREYTWHVGRPAKRWGEIVKELTPLDRIRNALTFHASFDEGVDADFAKGDATGNPAVVGEGRVQLVEGVSGKALLSGRDGVGMMYEIAGNLKIEEGTLSMWVRRVEWLDAKGDMSHSLFQVGRPGKGYFGFQKARFNRSLPYVQFYMIQYPWRQSLALNVAGDVTGWKPSEWHWIVMTWTAEQMSLYVDGLKKGSRGFTPPLSERDLTSTRFSIGKTSGGSEQTAVDEVRVFDRAFSEAEVRRARLFCQSSEGAAAWEAVQFDFGHYPYSRKLKARVDLNALKGREQVRGARLELRRVGSDEPLATIELPPFENAASEVIADVPDLPDGQYQLALRLEGGPEELRGELVREFPRQRFEWEGNRIGMSERILPPFTPIEVRGRTVRTVLREHVVSEQGLWQQVVAKGEPILAGPIGFEITINGKRRETEGRSLSVARKSDLEANVAAEWTAGAVTGRVTGRFDYDGMLDCGLELSGGEVDRVDLVIPVKDAMAPLGHFCGERLRANFAGYVPEGQGVVWDASKTLKHDLVGPFCPYIWVGAEERGICWFAENDRGWAVVDKTPCQEIERRDGVLTVRIRIIQERTALSEPRSIRFGLQATPVKPMPERPTNWRTWTNAKLPGAMHYLIAGSTLYIGTLHHEPFPFRRDLALWRKFGEARKTGNADYTFGDKWVDAYPEGLFKLRTKENCRNHVRGGFSYAGSQPDRYLVYVQGRGTTFRTPEFQTFQDEWTNSDYNTRIWRTGWQDGLAYRVEPVPSWQDFTLWWLKKQMEEFTDGLYFDNFFMIPVKDRGISSAYLRADGRIQPAVPVRNMRRMMRRTAGMYLEAGRHPMIGPHMTNTTLVPVMAFAQYGLDWEWHYGRSDYQDRWTRDHIRAACIGRQTGCAPVVIAIGSRGGDEAEVEWLNRSFNGVALTHELIPCWYTTNRHIPHQERKQRTTSRDLFFKTRAELLAAGVGTEVCRTYNYWAPGYPAAVAGIESSSIVHRGRGRTFVTVADWGEGGAASVTLDSAALRLSPDFRAVDSETGEAVPRSGNTLTFTLKKHDYKTIVIED